MGQAPPPARGVPARRLYRILQPTVLQCLEPQSRPWPIAASSVQWEGVELAKEVSMPSDESIEQRLAAVERAVADLQRQMASSMPVPNWLARFTGAFKDEPAFAEVVEYGRAIRTADRPPEDAGP